MKNITIQRLTLENFKCHRHLELALNGRSAGIYGDNATGKTSIYDALTWLLFGKDSQGNGEKNIDIKPLDAGGSVRDHEAITFVEAEMDVDGVPVTLKRTYREVWSTKRGSSTATYDGNTSDYYVDGVPCKKYAFEAKIGEIIQEDVFRLLTSIQYFPAEMDWRQRRKVLFDVAGVYTDREIMATDQRFSSLSAAAGRLELDDYRKKLQAERKGLTGLRVDIPARISENESRLQALSLTDYVALRQERQETADRKSALEQELAQVKHSSLLGTKQNQLDAVRNELQALENENRAHRRSQEKPDDAGRISKELEQARFVLRTSQDRSQSLRLEAGRLEKEIGECREQWRQFSAREFHGAVCPTCGQALTGAALDRARREHEARVEQGKAEAVRRSSGAKSRLEACQKDMEGLETHLREAQQRVLELDGRLQEARSAKAPEISDLPEYASKKRDLEAQADSLSNQIFNLRTDSAQAASGLRGQIRGLEAKLAELDSRLAQETMLASLQARIEELRQQAADAAGRLEEIDRMLYLLEEFTRYKTRYIEDSVNNKFHLARFRLFREQANGGLEERCDAMYQGVPYGSLNNGARINVGIDIIHTLSQCYGVCVPLFVDNAESVTKLEDAGTQVIRLVVSEKDKDLRCEYEN